MCYLPRQALQQTGLPEGQGCRLLLSLTFLLFLNFKMDILLLLEKKKKGHRRDSWTLSDGLEEATK